MRFLLTPRSMTLDDPNLIRIRVRILSEYRRISQIWEPTTTKRIKIDPNCQKQYYSPLNVLFSGVYITLISQGVPSLGVSNKSGVGITSYFRAKSVNISVRDTSKITMNDWQEGACFRLAPRSMTLNDFELTNFRGVSQICVATAAKRIYP